MIPEKKNAAEQTESGSTVTAVTTTPEQNAVIWADPAIDELVVAGAGSGKTFTMTERIIALMSAKDPSKRVAASSILGLTFTNKAAQELGSRVIERVSRELNGLGNDGDGGNGNDGGARGISRVESLTMRPEVMTYDAFFQQIVRHYGLLIGIDQSIMPLSDAGRYELASSVVSESMAELFSDESDAEGTDDGGAYVDTGDRDSDADDAEGDGDGDDASDGEPTSRFDKLVYGILQISDECLSYMIDEHRLSFDAALASAQEWNDAFIARARDIVAAGVADDPAAAETFSYPKNPSIKSRARKPEKREPEITAKNHVRALYRTHHLLEVAVQRRRLLRLAKIYNERKRENHFAEFADFVVYALQLLVRFPSIGEEYRRHYTHVFLDEYQDTSTTQAKLIARLFHPERTTAGETASAASRSAVTAVGDPFQSIYSWRGASPGAFALFRHDFGLDDVPPSPLTFSVRNPQKVLDLANALTVPLRQKEYLSRKGTASSSQVSEVDVGKLNVLDTPAHPAAQGTVAVAGYSSRTQEATAIAAFAKKYSDRYAADADTPVAVLVRSKSHMAQYAQALEAQGLSYEVVGFSDLMHKPEIQDLFSVLDAVTDHTDAGAVVRLLASPRFGLTGSQLRLLARLAEHLNMEQQYAALRQAGFGTGTENEEARRALVHDHRDVVPNLVSLVDLVMDDAVETLITRMNLPQSACDAILALSQILRAVETVANAGVGRALRTAVEALGLDVDLVVGNALAAGIRGSDAVGVSRAQVSTGIDAIAQLVDTYSAELPAGMSPSLRGFVKWIEALEKDPEEPAMSSGHRADVVLMTIHQAKGLGWRAVAVAGMTKNVFPSSSSVKVTSVENGYYTAISSTWIEEPFAVPAPMRSDAAILPRFPHTAVPGDPIGSLSILDSPETVDAEVYETDAEQQEIGLSHDFLSLREEYGSRGHADERRLAYVATTRSKNAVLLTFAGHPRYDASNGSALRTDLDPAAAGVFWNDAFDFVAGQNDGGEDSSLRWGEDPETLKDAEGLRRQMRGAVSGDDAGDLAKILTTSIAPTTNATLDAEVGKSSVVGSWPLELNEVSRTALKKSGWAVSAALHATIALDDTSGEGASSESREVAKGSLLERAALLVPDTHHPISEAVGTADKPLTSEGKPDAKTEEDPEMAQLRARVERVLPRLSLGATQMQRLASFGDGTGAGSSGERKELVGILRPVPQPPNFAADLGTRFHSWAQELLDEDSSTPEYAAGDGVDAEPETAKLLTWQHRLADSEWVNRPVEGLEEAYVIDIFGLRVVAKMDAVFRGGYRNDTADTERVRYTIVDWKTGRKPSSEEDVEHAQLQLDLYRLALSRNLEEPLESIDACLYYINQEKPSDRIIYADITQDERAILDHLTRDSALLQHLSESA
ncbi:MAG: ATP-dependent helicase [Bifidobacteriaceae bacterium]|jgi:DNA helicase-2/ATP-dependent DNA helicase PcrA|nr:ATP-dependent helicase [Bifidobacteriaceae bacterium]